MTLIDNIVIHSDSSEDDASVGEYAYDTPLFKSTFLPPANTVFNEEQLGDTQE